MHGLKLHSPLAANSPADPDDVLKAKGALGQLGYYKAPEWGISDIPDPDMIDGVKKFQKDNKLAVDGVMDPKGETEQKVNKKLNEAVKPNVPDLSGVGKAIELAATVGVKSTNQKDDVETVRQNLTTQGYLNPADAQKPAAQIFRAKPEIFINAIKKFQNDNGLKVDGKLNPDGETANRLINKLQITANAAGEPSGQDDATPECNLRKQTYRRLWRDQIAKKKNWDDLEKDFKELGIELTDLFDDIRDTLGRVVAGAVLTDLVGLLQGKDFGGLKAAVKRHLKGLSKLPFVIADIIEYQSKTELYDKTHKLIEPARIAFNLALDDKNNLRKWNGWGETCEYPTSPIELNS